MPTQDHGFVALIPVKSPSIGKSRLADAPDREALARAIALDTIRAASAATSVRRVLVVTDADFAPHAAGLGIEVVPDPGGGLNAALRAGAGVAAHTSPDLRPVALLADLPALTPAALDAALGLVGGGAAYCPDADDTGTTLLTSSYDDFDPRFGARSAAAHAAAGAIAIEGAPPGLRRDVDDLATLREAAAIGLGPDTSALLARTPHF
ncbi:MAG: 2-phospho-L-lactate guanylyltransferase [Nocardioidaceae bacterium]|nr:2-phospho-L-lactate guanylyltransferase [Nocardioidaceae bacterium]MCL2613099.1 2-phospho-L-lactate guanylyltransferase [Nocardioidaceae bacterium]